MICLVLAGGFATRMKPLTDNMPKALLPINGKSILSYIVEDLSKNSEIEKIIILTNNKFYEMFEKWREGFLPSNKDIDIYNNGVNSPKDNRGILNGIFQIIQSYDVKDDFMIAAGDNLLSFTTKYFVKYYFDSKQSSVMWYEENNLTRLQRTGVAIVNKEIIEQMQEKPINPIGNCAIPPLYIYSEEAIEYIRKCVELDCDFNSPGQLLEWLVPHISVRALKMPGMRYDVGDLQNYCMLKDDNSITYFSDCM